MCFRPELLKRRCSSLYYRANTQADTQAILGAHALVSQQKFGNVSCRAPKFVYFSPPLKTHVFSAKTNQTSLLVTALQSQYSSQYSSDTHSLKYRSTFAHSVEYQSTCSCITDQIWRDNQPSGTTTKRDNNDNHKQQEPTGPTNNGTPNDNHKDCPTGPTNQPTNHNTTKRQAGYHSKPPNHSQSESHYFP
jgi:hypothetical protein